MTTTINVKTPAQLKQAYQRIAKGITAPFKSTRRMFMQLGALIDRDTMLTFRHEGSYQGRERWTRFNYGRGVGFYDTVKGSTTRTRTGKWKRRPGTDGSKTRKYGMNSKLLQASGSYKNSFKIIKIGATKMRYGTQYGGKLAEYIMSNPHRPIIQYTTRDEKRYSDLIYRWWFKNIRI